MLRSSQIVSSNFFTTPYKTSSEISIIIYIKTLTHPMLIYNTPSQEEPSSRKCSLSGGDPLNEPREGRAQGLPLLLMWKAQLNSLHLCFVGQPPLHQVPSHQFRHNSSLTYAYLICAREVFLFSPLCRIGRCIFFFPYLF